jgi:uridylate kinase
MKKVVISLGGSVIVPDEVDTNFLKKFKGLIKKYPKNKFVIICGGGKLARNLQKEAKKLEKTTDRDLDWLGIYATRINALSLKNVLKVKGKIIANPNDKIEFKENVLVGGGWKPGFSTDYDAVLIAKNINADILINMTNVDYVYDKDPKSKDAKPIKEVKWKELRKIVGNKWEPGLNMPFDPIAAKEAEKLKMKVIVIGNDLKNLECVLNGKEFKGTLIQKN